MMPAHAPVETWQAERPAPSFHRAQVDAHRAAKPLTLAREREPVVARAQTLLLREAVEHEHSELAGQVIVAHARCAHSRIARSRVDLPRAGALGESGEMFDHR